MTESNADVSAWQLYEPDPWGAFGPFKGSLALSPTMPIACYSYVHASGLHCWERVHVGGPISKS